MKKTTPIKTLYYCDMCNKEISNYVDYPNNFRLRIKRKKERRLFSFFRKDMINADNWGMEYRYNEMMICGECYDSMVKYVKEMITKKDLGDDNV